MLIIKDIKEINLHLEAVDIYSLDILTGIKHGDYMILTK